MANEATLGILLTMRDTATPKLAGFKNTLVENRTALRELTMGMGFLGASFVSMGVMLKQSNTEMGNTVGNTLLMAGSVMTAVSASVHFIRAIADIVKALKVLVTWEILAKAFQPGMGWVTLLAGGAIAAGTIAGVNAMSKGEQRSQVNITNNIQGSVVTDKQIAETIRREVIKTQQRNNTSGIK